MLALVVVYAEVRLVFAGGVGVVAVDGGATAVASDAERVGLHAASAIVETTRSVVHTMG
jgi:hypothetical protein